MVDSPVVVGPRPGWTTVPCDPFPDTDLNTVWGWDEVRRLGTRDIEDGLIYKDYSIFFFFQQWT